MEHTYNLFLDDFRVPKDCCKYIPHMARFYFETPFIIVRNYDAFVKLISDKYAVGQLPIIISFDHDLADEHYADCDNFGRYNEWAAEQNFKEKTGYDCAKWLVEFCMEKDIDVPKFVVHSKNPAGAENITSYLHNYQKSREA